MCNAKRYALAHERPNQVLRNAAESKAAYHDGGAIIDITDRILGAIHDLVHGPLLPKDSNTSLTKPAILSQCQQCRRFWHAQLTSPGKRVTLSRLTRPSSRGN